jgi:hypothetical protein
MTQSRATKSKSAEPKSMADAIARVKAAAARQDRARAAGVEYTASMRRLLFTDVRPPSHPHAKLVQRVTLGMFLGGMAAIILLPDVFLVHWAAFTCMFALLFIGVPNLLLQQDGSLSPTKITGWAAVLLLFGAMTATAAGDTGNLWSWAPWLQQFSVGAHPPSHVTTPKP